MNRKLCVFTLYFAYNRQVRLRYLEKIMPKDVELFLFTKENEKSKFSLKRFKIFTCKSDFSSFFELRKFCKEHKIDAILNLGQLPQEGCVMIFSTMFSKTKSFIYMVGNPFYNAKNHKKGWKFKAFIESIFFFPLLYFPDKFFFASDDLMQAVKKLSIFKNKIKYLPGTIDTSLFKPKKLKKAKKNLIFVGRIEYSKGADIILELAKLNKDITFILIGNVDDKKFEKPIENIKIYPPQASEKLVNFYNASDLCIFPSRIEGFGLVPREAMACGVPAMVSDIYALRRIKQAIKVPISVENFNKAIKDFFKLSIKQRKELGEKSRENIIKEYSDQACKGLYLRELLE